MKKVIKFRETKCIYIISNYKALRFDGFINLRRNLSIHLFSTNY